MTLSLLALFIIPFALKAVLDPNGLTKFFKKLAKEEEWQIAAALAFWFLALLIFSYTGLNFNFNKDSLLTWLGLIIAIRGLLFFSPRLSKACLTPIYKKENLLPIIGFVFLVLALFLIYFDTQILPN